MRVSVIVFGIALLVANGCDTTGRQRGRAAENGTDHTIYVVSLGWHTGIAVRGDSVDPSLWSEAIHFPRAEYLEIGWGDRDFYQIPGATIATTLKAALLPTDAVMHVADINDPMSGSFHDADIVALRLSDSDFNALLRFVGHSFARGGNKTSGALRPGLYPNSHFYPALGTFYLFNNCNNWVARALQAGGCDMSPSWAFASELLLFQARRCAESANANDNRPTTDKRVSPNR